MFLDHFCGYIGIFFKFLDQLYMYKTSVTSVYTFFLLFWILGVVFSLHYIYWDREVLSFVSHSYSALFIMIILAVQVIGMIIQRNDVAIVIKTLH